MWDRGKNAEGQDHSIPGPIGTYWAHPAGTRLLMSGEEAQEGSCLEKG